MIIEGMEIEEFINQQEIEDTLAHAQHASDEEIAEILARAERFAGLKPLDVAKLLMMDDKHLPELFRIARKIKEAIYGNRIVMFAPLYVSDYCVNHCLYCSYNKCHQ